MCARFSLVTPVAVVITALVLVAEILLSSHVFANESTWVTRTYRTTAPAVPLRPLDEKDEIAALERIQYALSEVGDGSTYVWRRWHGLLSGVIYPKSSYRDASGRVCRNLLVLMTTAERTSTMEGTACRLETGRWQLKG
jgi:outer membrane surface antigen